MCDTIAVVRKNEVWLAKNSDRDVNEAQILEWHPRRTHAAGSTVACTWIEIPQVAETNAVLISRPFWMWGAEMGANEHHVVIGNEAVFTKQPYNKTGLLGMDLLRLALERADTAEKACNIITALMQEHGQGGGAGHENRRFTYHNSYIIADPNGAIVLETAGNEFATERVEGTRTISNGLTIPGFAEKHSESLKTRVSQCRLRRPITARLASKTRNARHLFAALRDHGAGNANPPYRWLNGAMGCPCMHAGGVATGSQTTGSWVTRMSKDGAQHWATGTAAPCTGIFKPIAVDQPLDLGSPSDAPDDSLWWRHEQLHRAVMRNPEALRDLFIPERNATETAWVEDPPDSHAAFEQADELLAKWTDAVCSKTVNDVRPF